MSYYWMKALDSGEEATVGSSNLPSKFSILSWVEKLSLPVSSILLYGYPISEERIRLQHQALVCPPKMCYCVAASKCCTRKVNWERCHKKLENALFSRHLNFFHVLYVYDWDLSATSEAWLGHLKHKISKCIFLHITCSLAFSSKW